MDHRGIPDFFLFFVQVQADGDMPIPVRVAPVQLAELAPGRWMPGTVIGRFDSRVAAEVEGRIDSLLDIGEQVRKGMVLDASIVLLENIVRLREKRLSPDEASGTGVDQVRGALLASTATTVAIFLPIVFLREEAGQLFADLALTITAAICMSLVVAITVVPTFAKLYLGERSLTDPHHHWWEFISDCIMQLTDTPVRRIFWIVVLIALPLFTAYKLLPNADYLPEGNRNLVFAFIQPLPGANISQIEHEMGRVIADRLEPYINGKEEPAVKHYFFVAVSRGVFLGVRAEDPRKIDALLPLVQSVIAGFPDTLAFASKASLFGGFGEGRTVDMDLQGRDIASLMQAGLQGFLTIPQVITGSTVRPFPGLELAQPELRLIPDDRRIAEAGWDRATMAGITRALGDGLFVGDYFDGEQTIDIVVRAEPWDTPEELMSIPLATPGAGVLPVGELLHVVRTSGPEEIRRINRRRTVTLRVTPPENISLEETLEILAQVIEPQIRTLLPEDGDIRYSGTADKLKTALSSMKGSFLLAIAMLYLLMSALFRSFRDSLLVILSIPLATVGGVIALNLINIIPPLLGYNVFQPMDLLTMIGFVILLGIVVNNAILLVYQGRMGEHFEGLGRRDAVSQSVHIRLRPILMSTLTSVFGMLPLLLVPGPGTELYRELAGVIVGGMLVSMVFTLILLPGFLRIGEGNSGGVKQVS